MLRTGYTDRSGGAERVLLIAGDTEAAAPLAREFGRRDAALTTAASISQAAASCRAGHYDVIVVAAREDAHATALLVSMARAVAKGAPRVLLLIDVSQAERYAAAIALADETASIALSARRLADTAGIGFQQGSAFG